MKIRGSWGRIELGFWSNRTLSLRLPSFLALLVFILTSFSPNTDCLLPRLKILNPIPRKNFHVLFVFVLFCLFLFLQKSSRKGLWSVCLSSVSAPGSISSAKHMTYCDRLVLVTVSHLRPLGTGCWQKSDGKVGINWRLLQFTMQMLVPPEF